MDFQVPCHSVSPECHGICTRCLRQLLYQMGQPPTGRHQSKKEVCDATLPGRADYQKTHCWVLAVDSSLTWPHGPGWRRGDLGELLAWHRSGVLVWFPLKAIVAASSDVPNGECHNGQSIKTWAWSLMNIRMIFSRNQHQQRLISKS